MLAHFLLGLNSCHMLSAAFAARGVLHANDIVEQCWPVVTGVLDTGLLASYASSGTLRLPGACTEPPIDMYTYRGICV